MKHWTQYRIMELGEKCNNFHSIGPQRRLWELTDKKQTFSSRLGYAYNFYYIHKLKKRTNN